MAFPWKAPQFLDWVENQERSLIFMELVAFVSLMDVVSQIVVSQMGMKHDIKKPF